MDGKRLKSSLLAPPTLFRLHNPLNSLMATIKPFRGIRFNPGRINDMSSVVTPPYDVISPDEQQAFYKKHPNNIIRLTKGEDLEGDCEKANKYTRAASFFSDWCDKGVLQEEAEPAIYVYEQIFEVAGASYSRKGFIAGVKLEEFNTGHIYPHEQTLSGPKADRFRLITECSANFSCIFSLYPDGQSGKGSVDAILNANTTSPPDVTFTDDEGVINNLWVTKEKDVINEIVSLMADKPLFIADGHHRYETALSYRNKRRDDSRNGGGATTDYVMMMCVSMDNPGLKILPTHRVVRDVGGLSDSDIMERLRTVFDVKPVETGDSVGRIAAILGENRDRHAFIAYLHDERQFYLLTSIDERLDSMDVSLTYSSWRYFDVGILHGIVFDKLLGIDNSPATNERKIEYVKEESDAISMVNDNGCRVAFFLNTTKIEDIQVVARERQIMPPKSTYFYPKLITGMVINRL